MAPSPGRGLLTVSAAAGGRRVHPSDGLGHGAAPVPLLRPGAAASPHTFPRKGCRFRGLCEQVRDKGYTEFANQALSCSQAYKAKTTVLEFQLEEQGCRNRSPSSSP